MCAARARVRVCVYPSKEVAGEGEKGRRERRMEGEGRRGGLPPIQQQERKKKTKSTRAHTHRQELAEGSRQISALR